MKRSDPLQPYADTLAELRARGLHRAEPQRREAAQRSFCSNDYLGFAELEPPKAASGSGSSRLVGGSAPEHAALEAELAEWLGAESVLTFSSGYAANVGTVSALLRQGDLVVSDALNHASLIDGVRLSRAKPTIVPHLSVDAVAKALAARGDRRAWVLVESYYSMDADGPDLAALRDLCDRWGAGLLVDEAHALGVLGPSGRGRCAAAGVRPDALVGTLGKALGAQGAFVAGRSVLRDWLWNHARSFVFSTGLAPASAAAALRALRRTRGGDDLRLIVERNARRLRDGLATAFSRRGSRLRVHGFGHVIPVVVGECERAMAIAGALRARGIHVQAIRPPTVPAGTARLRFTVSASHSEDEIDRAINAVEDVLRPDP